MASKKLPVCMETEESLQNNNIFINKVVSKNFIIDIVSKIQNLLGMNLVSYEKMIEKAKKQIWEELKERKVKLKWYRYEISELTNGAMVIVLYGESQ